MNSSPSDPKPRIPQVKWRVWWRARDPEALGGSQLGSLGPRQEARTRTAQVCEGRWASVPSLHRQTEGRSSHCSTWNFLSSWFWEERKEKELVWAGLGPIQTSSFVSHERGFTCPRVFAEGMRVSGTPTTSGSLADKVSCHTY